MVLVRGGITVKPHVQRAADLLVERFGAGLSPGTYPGHSEPEGPTQALDLFTPDNPNGWALQDAICDFLRENAVALGVRYVIRREYIWNIERDAEGWRWQGRKNNRRLDHYDHVHVTFYARAAGSVPINNPSPEPTPTMKELATMDFTYSFGGEDYLFLASLNYFGKLPFGATLDGLKHHKLIYNVGGANAEFHRGIVALASAARMTPGIQ